MITQRQVNLVKASWAVVAHTNANAAILLYSRLAELDQRLAAPVRDEMEQDGEHIVRRIDAAVYGFDAARPTVTERAGTTQAAYLRYAFYDTFAAALFWTLARRMGDRFTDEMFKAWSALYVRLFAAMQMPASRPDMASAA